jgi:hypothetical protein
MSMDITLYHYIESLDVGRETFSHLGRLGNMTLFLYQNRTLNGLCTSEPMQITQSSQGGRRLKSDVFFVNKIDLIVPVRFCSE